MIWRMLGKKGFSYSLLIILILSTFGCSSTVAVQQTEEIKPEPTAVVEKTEEIGAGPSDYSGNLVISTWGGTTEEFIKKNVEPQFNILYPNVKVIYDIGGQSARYGKILAEKENPQADVFASGQEIIPEAMKNGLLAKLNLENIPNAEFLHDWALVMKDNALGYSVTAVGFGYNPDYFGDNPPTSWADLWRPDLQGKTALLAIGHSHMPALLIVAAELNGGGVDDIQKGLDYLAQLKPAAQGYFYTDWQAQFDAGDIVLAVDFDEYINYMKSIGSNIKFVLPKEGGLGNITNLSVVAGTKHQDVAEAFINVYLSKDVQAALASELLNAPSRNDVEISPEIDELLAAYGASLDNVRFFDPNLIAEHRGEWTELLNNQVAPEWAK